MGEAEPRRSESGALSTRRLQLRPLRAQDGVVLAELAALHAVRRDLSLALFAVSAGKDGESFVVWRQADRTVVGAGGYGASREALGAVEFALWIAAAEWGRGYGTEAAQALIDRAFTGVAVTAVTAAIRVTNARARRLVEKCGLQPRGTGMARASAETGAFPVERFALSRSAWASLKAWGARATGSDGDGPRQTAA